MLKTHMRAIQSALIAAYHTQTRCSRTHTQAHQHAPHISTRTGAGPIGPQRQWILKRLFSRARPCCRIHHVCATIADIATTTSTHSHSNRFRPEKQKSLTNASIHTTSVHLRTRLGVNKNVRKYGGGIYIRSQCGALCDYSLASHKPHARPQSKTKQPPQQLNSLHGRVDKFLMSRLRIDI